MEPLNYRIPEACRRSGASRTKIYEALRTGELKAKKLGRVTLIAEAELTRWVRSWSAYEPRIPAPDKIGIAP